VHDDPEVVSETEWVSCLLRRETAVAVDMHGFPFRFSPPAEWDTREQRISQHLVYYVVRGGCRARVAGEACDLAAGNLCWVRPDERFRFFDARRGAVLQRFRLSVTRRGRRLTLPWRSRVFPAAQAAAERSAELVRERPDDRFSRERTACLTALFSLELFSSGAKEEVHPGLSAEVQARIARAVLDEGNFRLTPRELARMAGLSPDYFSRQFRLTYGLPPREWLLRQRLRHAAGLLAETDERISQIAVRLGYPDLYLFSRQFSAEFGLSPRAWRRNHRQSGPRKRILP
jgi:AraC-like DNA-binding protein